MTITQGPWTPFAPSAADPWDLHKVAHLHRRAGFGVTWANLQHDFRAGATASVDRLLNPPAPTAEETQILDCLRQGVLDSRDAERLKAWWLYRMLYDPDPLREKMTLFWHSHFATSNRKVQSIPLMLRQNDLLRRHALGDFSALLRDILADPAMLVWLDGAGSTKTRPNENLAREFLELFALGFDHYTEDDVRAAARAFAGWIRTREGGFQAEDQFHYDPTKVDEGVKTFLKQTGPWKPADIVRITLEQPACALHLCRKLYRFFVGESEEPAADLIEPLAEELRSHRYDMGHVVGIILRSQHFYSRAAYRQRVKSPVEFSVGLIHTLEVPRRDMSLLALAVACERQGQELFYPPNVKGWDGGRTWINSTTVLERGNWVADVLWGNADLGLKPFNPLSLSERCGLPQGKTVGGLLDLLLQDDVAAEVREIIVRTGADGKADSLRKALQLVLHCPEYQLA
jgi:uncharacterized protein (DUF1800 family)